MKIIPAIDIMDKKVVRLERGDFGKSKVYSENPVLMAGKWKELGAELLHVVDLDGARLGKPVNLDVIEEIVKNVNSITGSYKFFPFETNGILFPNALNILN